jgi:hypothetical protein
MDSAIASLSCYMDCDNRVSFMLDGLCYCVPFKLYGLYHSVPFILDGLCQPVPFIVNGLCQPVPFVLRRMCHPVPVMLHGLCHPVRFVLCGRLCLRPCGPRGSRNCDHWWRLLSPRDSVLIIDHFPSVRTLLKPCHAAYVGLQHNILSLHSVPRDTMSLFWKQEMTAAAVSVPGFGVPSL